MSNKYVPAFLKNQQNTNNNNNTLWNEQKQSTQLNTTNKFAALDDDFRFKKEKPIINTSLPSRTAPKFVPATLASLTNNNNNNNNNNSSNNYSGNKRSFASKFAEQTKITSDPNYVPPPKPINVASENDFPSLGAPKKSTSTVWGNKTQSDNKPSTLSFADKAKEWAKQKEEEAEEAQRKAAEEKKMRREAEFHKRMNVIGINRYQRKYVDEDDEDQIEQSSLGDDDSYEVPEYEEEPSEEDCDDGEFNPNIGWDGRHKDDLY
jgi:hypothetical protein